MTPQEHELMLLMFARVYERLEVIRDALKSSEIWVRDDPDAFDFAVHSDPIKLTTSLLRAARDYGRAIRESGVPLDQELQAFLQAIEDARRKSKE